MLELLLLRHAKSRWDMAGAADHDRDLAPRGEKAALRMGRLIAEQGLLPDRVLCSTATRARRTWELASGELTAQPELLHRRDLYLAPSGRLLDAVRASGGDVRRLMLVGHNPGLHDLAQRLVGDGDVALRRKLAEKLPTAALVHLAFEAPRWPKLALRSGRLLGFWRPRDLD
jgi:phosphohistidine phosphatase